MKKSIASTIYEKNAGDYTSISIEANKIAEDTEDDYSLCQTVFIFEDKSKLTLECVGYTVIITEP